MIDDKECLKNIIEGSEIALETLYGRYAKIVFNTILSYTKNEADAEEILQDVFVTIYKKANAFKFDSSAKTWIYRIAVNKSLDFLKKKKASKRFAIFTSIYKNNSVEVKHDPLELKHPGVVLESQENATLLYDAIGGLSENQQTAFILTQIEDLSQLEAAEIMETSRKAVESLVQRAKQNLRIALEKHYPERGKFKKNTSNKVRKS
jgi:RNA polymerase sigma-70 factor (ECF subfamily)